MFVIRCHSSRTGSAFWCFSDSDELHRPSAVETSATSSSPTKDSTQGTYIVLMLYGTTFDALEVHFDKLCLLSDVHAEKIEIRKIRYAKHCF
jgi:hypothetical protein